MPSSELAYEYRGTRYKGHLAYDSTTSGPRPGVLVIHEAAGLGEHAKERADRLAAELGYTAYAMDLFGETPANLDEMIAWIQKLMADPAELRGRLNAALAVLRGQPGVDGTRLGAIGYCFGGTSAIELARSGADVKTTVAFHAGLQGTSSTDATNIRGKLLICNGAQDPFMPADVQNGFTREMVAAGVDWQMNLYGKARHSFTNRHAESFGSDAYAYDSETDARSWQAMVALFTECFARG